MRQKIIQIVSETIANESNAIANLTKIIDLTLIESVKCIYNCKGRVIVSGIGKSALVAKKISATFNSTGTKSIFLHAADALHGDVGVINEDDVVLLLSKSGNTPELKVLVPILKNNKNKIIGITGNQQGFLSQQADYNIVFEIEAEACPINLAPTTSTTVQMVIGDAIANALLHLRGFKASDFLKFHPAGSLGKQLYVKIEDIMTAENLPVAFKNSPVKKVIMEMSSKRFGAVVVVNKANNIKGIVTDGDLRRMLETEADIETVVAGEIMSKKPKEIKPKALAIEGLNLMQQHQISQLLVVENKQLKGIIHLQDILKEGIV